MGYFCKKNMELGRITELEMDIYDGLLNNMMQELAELPKKAPDLMVYLKGSFETVLARINKRGRGYELDPALVEYYHHLWKDYDDWVMNHYKASQVLVIDMDNTDVVNNEEDKIRVINEVKNKLDELRSA